MQLHSKEPKNHVPGRRRAKRNIDTKEPNCFELINSIPKQTGYILKKVPDAMLMVYTERLLMFCEQFYPLKVDELEFDESNDLNDLCKALFEMVSKKYTIDTDFEHGNKDFCIMEAIDFEHDHWFNVEVKFIETIPVFYRPFYAQILANMSEYIENDQSNYLSGITGKEATFHLSDILEYELNDWYELDRLKEAIDVKEASKEDKELFRSVNKQVMTHKKGYATFNKYFEKKRGDIFKRKAKDEIEQGLLDLIKEGLFDRDFRLINMPAPSHPGRENGGIDYSDAFVLFWDINGSLEQSHLDFEQERGQNDGQSTPCRWWVCRENGVDERMSDADVKEFAAIQDFIDRFTSYLYDNYPTKADQ